MDYDDRYVEEEEEEENWEDTNWSTPIEETLTIPQGKLTLNLYSFIFICI